MKSHVIIYRLKSRKKSRKKNVKKKGFSFLQTFFLKSILDIYLCPNSKIKKEFQKGSSFSSFLLLLFGEMEQHGMGLFCNARNDP
jgi:hypothetical protein